MTVGTRRATGVAVSVLAAAALAGTGIAGKGKLDVTKVKVGFSPIDIAAGDFDRDGRKDLAVSNFNSEKNTVSILRGRGEGKFKVAKTIKLDPGDQPHGIAVARIGNGKDLDLAVGTFGTDVILLKGRKGAGFRSPVPLPIGQQPRRVAAGDFNEDGRTDLAASRQQDQTIAVVLGQGGLSFSAPVAYAGGGGGGPVVAANLDAGGDPDLATIDHSDDALSVFLGQAGSGFVLTNTLTPPAEPVSLAVADLNRDGRRDVIAGLVGDRPRLTVFRGLEGGGFAPAATLTVGPRPMLIEDIEVTKLDRNGDPDLVIVGNEASGIRAVPRGGGELADSRVLFLEGRAGIELQRVREVKVSERANAVAAARLDGVRPTDAAVARARTSDKRGHAVIILNP